MDLMPSWNWCCHLKHIPDHFQLKEWSLRGCLHHGPWSCPKALWNLWLVVEFVLGSLWFTPSKLSKWPWNSMSPRRHILRPTSSTDIVQHVLWWERRNMCFGRQRQEPMTEGCKHGKVVIRLGPLFISPNEGPRGFENCFKKRSNWTMEVGPSSQIMDKDHLPWSDYMVHGVNQTLMCSHLETTFI